MWIIFWWEIFHKKRVAPRSMKKFVFLSFDSISSLHSSLQKEHKKRQKNFFLLFITMLQKFSNAKQLVECWMKKRQLSRQKQKNVNYSQMEKFFLMKMSEIFLRWWWVDEREKKIYKKEEKRHKSNIKRLKILNLLNCKICRVIYNNENGENDDELIFQLSLNEKKREKP